jgi:hypothetical protein
LQLVLRKETRKQGEEKGLLVLWWKITWIITGSVLLGNFFEKDFKGKEIICSNEPVEPTD